MNIAIETLMEQVGSKYALTTICAQRAKQINAGAKILIDDVTGKPDGIALREIMAQKVRVGQKPPAAEPVEEAPTTKKSEKTKAAEALA